MFGSQVQLQMLLCLSAAAQPAGSAGPELQPAALMALEQFMSLPVQKGAESALSKGEAGCRQCGHVVNISEVMLFSLVFSY